MIDWMTDAERMRLMQADIDALKCERAELIDAMSDIAGDTLIGNMIWNGIGDDESMSIRVPLGMWRRAASLLSRYGR